MFLLLNSSTDKKTQVNIKANVFLHQSWDLIIISIRVHNTKCKIDGEIFFFYEKTAKAKEYRIKKPLISTQLL